MSERELVDWLGKGNAEPGSTAYNHAQLVVESKRNHRLLHQGLGSEPSRPDEEENEPLSKLTGAFWAFLALVVAVGGILAVVLPWGWAKAVVVITAVVVVVLALTVPVARRGLSGWLDSL